MEHSKANDYMVENKVGEQNVVIASRDMPELPVLFLKDCRVSFLYILLLLVDLELCI
jgi:hypothetical protein